MLGDRVDDHELGIQRAISQTCQDAIDEAGLASENGGRYEQIGGRAFRGRLTEESRRLFQQLT